MDCLRLTNVIPAEPILVTCHFCIQNSAFKRMQHGHFILQILFCLLFLQKVTTQYNF